MLELHAFGPPDLRSEEGDLGPLLTQPKRLALLTYLMLARPRGYHRRDTVLALFWPELDQTHGRKALSQSLFILRRTLPDGVLLTRGAEEVGVDAAEVRCDVFEFEEALQEERWAEAVARYQGELLTGLHVGDAPGFERWLDGERERFRELAAGAAWHLAKKRIQAGELVEAERAAQRALFLVPTDESPVRGFIEALASAGDRAAALRFFEKFEAVLAKELEVEPSQETLAVVESLRRGGKIPGAGGRTPGDESEAGGDRTRDSVPADTSAVAGDRLQRGFDGITALEARGESPWRWPWIAGAAVILLLAVILTVLGRNAPTPLSHRVAVLPFENRTGDEAFDALGVVAADWITGGLVAIQGAQVVPSSTVLATLSAPEARADQVRWIARELHAGLAVEGFMVQVGDSLEIRSHLVDASAGAVLDSFEPVRAHRSDPTAALGPIRRQIMGRVALRLDEEFSGLALVANQKPPSYEAYRAYIAGVELFFRYRFRDAIRELGRAWAADTAFAGPGIWIASAFGNLGDLRKKDSVLQLLEAHRAELSFGERGTLDLMQAQLEGDAAAVYRIAREGYRRRPSTEARLFTGQYAYNTNRPREAVQTLRSEPESGATRNRWIGFHRTLTGALHILAEYDEEVEAAREAQGRFPDDPRPVFWEARALIGMGRIGDGLSLIDRGTALPSEDWSPGDLELQAGLELRAHGHPDAGEHALRRAIEWYRGEDGGPQARLSMGRAYLALEEPDSAVELFRELVDEEPEALDHRGYLGLALASAGRTDGARQMDALLAAWSEPYLRGRNLYWRAAIAARLGELEEAMTFLRESLSQGVTYPLLYENEDLRPLWAYPPFRKLLEPRG